MLNVIYDDNHIIAVVKPQNVPTQEDITGDKDMLTMVKEYVKEKYNKPGNVFIGLVHRLDRPTGGVMVFARTSKAANKLSRQIQEKTFEKTYYAVVKGVPKQPRNTLINYIQKDLRENKASIVPMDVAGAKKSVLHYELIDTQDNLSLLKINLETGRSHQIRLQLSNIGLPIYGDAKYGNVQPGLKTTNLALWAANLSFQHPTQERKMLFKVFPPEDKAPWNKFDLNRFI